MKVDHNSVASTLGNVGLNARVQSAGSKTASNSPAGANASGSGDAINLSGQSSIFASALTAGEGARAARVEQLRQVYGSGANPVDSQELSQAILDADFRGRSGG